MTTFYIKQQLKPDEAPSHSILEAFQDLSDNLQYVANKFVNKPSQNNAASNSNRIHMPKIELMRFSGDDVSIWPIFFLILIN